MHGGVTYVDDEYYEELSKHKWYLHIDGYASRRVQKDFIRKTIMMHREIMGVSDRGLHTQVDHINHDKLNNTKENLRICTIRENQRNRPKSKRGESIYKGVCRCSRGKYWRSLIQTQDGRLDLGKFKTQEEAALAYNEAAIKYHGEFAYLNKVENSEAIVCL